MLNSAQLSFYVNEYKKAKKHPEWFSMFSGPRNRRELSKYLNRSAEYSMLYGKWSSVSHAADLHRFLTSNTNGKPAFWCIRNPESLQETANYTVVFTLRAIRLMKDKYRSQEDISKWYKEEILEKWHSLADLKIKVVAREV